MSIYEDPKMWGPPFWFMLRTFSHNYPDNPSAEDIMRMTVFLESLQYFIPCDKCAATFKLHLQDYPLNSSCLSSKDHLVSWVEKINTATKRIIFDRKTKGDHYMASDIKYKIQNNSKRYSEEAPIHHKINSEQILPLQTKSPNKHILNNNNNSMFIPSNTRNTSTPNSITVSDTDLDVNNNNNNNNNNDDKKPTHSNRDILNQSHQTINSRLKKLYDNAQNK